MSLPGGRLATAFGASLVAGACITWAWVVATVVGSGDYSARGQVVGDNAGPAIDALAHGRLAGMVSVQPLMGLTSIVWRAPFVGLAELLGGSDRLVYGLGTMACLLPVTALLVWLAGRAASLTQLAAVALAAAAIVAGPATLQAARIGHPEEVLATVLAAGAVISASADRRGWAAALLGLAIGTKQWAFLAAPCVLLALPDARAAVAARAALVAGPAIALLPLANPAAFSRADASVGGITFVDPFSIWWPLAPLHREWRIGAHLLPLGLTRSEAAAAALLLTVTAVWAYARRIGAGRAPRVDGLALLALLGLLRCVTDPDPLTYNFVALVIPLALWEAAIRKRLPIATALTCAALLLLGTGEIAFRAGRGLFVGPSMLSVLWISGAVTLGCYLARGAFRPRTVTGRRHEMPPAVLQPAIEHN